VYESMKALGRVGYKEWVLAEIMIPQEQIDQYKPLDLETDLQNRVLAPGFADIALASPTGNTQTTRPSFLLV
jgi:hypothetical protein